MNLFQLNTGIDNRVLQSAEYDIRRYINFINKSIDFLKEEQLPINITKQIVEIEIVKEGNRQKIKETRYTPQAPSNKKSEKAIDILFNENTKEIFAKKSFSREDGIRLLEQNEDENYFTLTGEIEGELIYLKPDLNQLQQQFYALRNLKDKPLGEHIPLLELFGSPDSSNWNQRYSPKSYDWKILTDDDKDGVSEQREFVSKSLQTKDFALMEGPPGSGKTTTIIELIMQFTAEGKRVLLCSATHAAIDNVIERIKGRYKEICDKEIVPVRISRFEQPVKESVRPYLLKNLVATYKTDIEQHLKKNQNLESQKFLLKNLYKNEEKEIDPIEKIILDSANLVAGTMIGILQHPDIRANKQGASFDVLIVDEASKVTFSDFIVPALHAKKWILVGDVKQLSPYVENDYVSENIATMLDDETQKSIVKQFELKSKLDDKKFEDCLKVFFTDQNPNTERQLVESKELVIEIVDESWEANENNIAKINSADIVIAQNESRVKQLLSSNIQVKSIFINGQTSSLQQSYRQEYARQSFKNPLPYLFDSRQEDWSEMVSSRLNQSFSFRNAGTEFENIDKELKYLIPDKFQDEINRIKRIAFPSILELLQNGIGKGGGQSSNKVLSDGFHPHYKTSRFISLTYQHRMHPDIARTSKESFYDTNLKTASHVLKRKWDDEGKEYKPNEPIVKWFSNNYNYKMPFEKNRAELEKWFYKNNNPQDKYFKRDLNNFLSWVNGKIFNPREIDDMENELKKFLKWANENPRMIKNERTGKLEKQNYEVAVLSFYLHQESELKKIIRRITGQRTNHSKFQMPNTDIYLYTVDKFQGQEADLVLLGFAKYYGDAHFNSPNRLNVALTRARFKLILFGNRPWFKDRAKLKALRDLATNFESTIRYEK